MKIRSTYFDNFLQQMVETLDLFANQFRTLWNFTKLLIVFTHLFHFIAISWSLKKQIFLQELM